MKRWYTGLLALALVTPAGARAQVPLPCGILPGLPTLQVPIEVPNKIPGQAPVVLTSGAFAVVRVNQTCLNLTPLIGFNRGSGLFELLVSNLVVGSARISLDVDFNPDPYISFSGSTTNLDAGPTAYTFYFGTSIVPGHYDRASSTGSFSVTSGDAGSSTVAQDGSAPFITVYGTDGGTRIPMGVNIGTGTCTAGAASTTCQYPPPSGGPATNTLASPVFLDNLETEIAYTQTDANSQVAFTGRADVFFASRVAAVPEPGTVALVATGLLGVAGVGAARRRRDGAR